MNDNNATLGCLARWSLKKRRRICLEPRTDHVMTDIAPAAKKTFARSWGRQTWAGRCTGRCTVSWWCTCCTPSQWSVSVQSPKGWDDERATLYSQSGPGSGSLSLMTIISQSKLNKINLTEKFSSRQTLHLFLASPCSLQVSRKWWGRKWEREREKWHLVASLRRKNN